MKFQTNHALWQLEPKVVLVLLEARFGNLGVVVRGGGLGFLGLKRTFSFSFMTTDRDVDFSFGLDLGDGALVVADVVETAETYFSTTPLLLFTCRC